MAKSPATVLAEINQYITANGVGAISGPILNGVLQDLCALVPPAPLDSGLMGYDASGNPLAVGEGGGMGGVATSIAAMQALPGSAGAVVYLNAGGRSGNFAFNTSNLSTQVANDPSQAIYVAPASDTTGASGAWVRQYSGDPSALWFGILNDGVTDNTAVVAAYQTFLAANATVSLPTTVTISIASPAVITWTGHLLRAGQLVKFSTTGALPTGITAGTPYFVQYGSVTTNTFEITTQNPIPWTNPLGTAINTSGSQSGVHSGQVLGNSWVTSYYPPGPYHLATNTFMGSSTAARKARVLAYGAEFDQALFGSNAWFQQGGGVIGGAGGGYLFNTVTISSGGGVNSITCTTVAQAANFRINSWVLLLALDVQGNGFPPNNQYFEFIQVASANATTGVVTFYTNLKNSYRSTYPTFPPLAGLGTLVGGGAAMAYNLNDTFDCDLEVFGITVTTSAEVIAGGIRSVKFIDSIFNGGQGAFPTDCKIWVAENCIWTGQSSTQVDKLIELATFRQCIFYAFEPSNVACEKLEMDGGFAFEILGTPKNAIIRNMTIGNLAIGCKAGVSETLLLENNRIQSLTTVDSTQGLIQVSFFTFSNGTLSFPIASGCVTWAVPGCHMYVSILNQNNNIIGFPFTVLDLRTDGTNQLIDTTLTALPTVAGQTLVFQPIACPRVTIRNCTGGPTISDQSNGPSEVPLFSYCKRSLAGKLQSTNTNSTQPRIYGYLNQLTINVITPYTGAASPMTMTLSCTVNNAGVPATLTQTINLAIGGLRTIGATATSGAQTGDTLAASTGWLNGLVAIDYPNTPTTDTALGVFPTVDITCQTIQTVETGASLMAGTFHETFALTYADTTT